MAVLRPSGMHAARTALALGTVAVLLPLPATPALACSCAGSPSDAEQLGKADVVVSGEVLERREPGPSLPWGSADLATYVVRVERVHKGDAAPVVEVRTARSGASCGLELPGHGPALLFLDEADGELRGGLCQGSRPATGAEAVASLGAGRPPGPEGGRRDDGAGAALPLAAAALVVLTGLAVLLGRRRTRADP